MMLFLLFLLRVDVVEGGVATLSLFGKDGRQMDVDRLLRSVHGSIATFLLTFGMCLSLFASAGLVPSLLEPGRIELLLSKPVSRAHLLLGRYLGNTLIVLANSTWLVVGVWLIFGLKTGVWTPWFLFTIATSVFLFCVHLPVVLLVGVIFESTALATMVPVAMMIVSAILAQESWFVKLLGAEWARLTWKVLHQALPSSWDIGAITFKLVRQEPIDSWMPLLTSAVFAAAVLGIALWHFERRDF